MHLRFAHFRTPLLRWFHSSPVLTRSRSAPEPGPPLPARTPRKVLSHFFASGIDFLYPLHCAVCDLPLLHEEWLPRTGEASRRSFTPRRLFCRVCTPEDHTDLPFHP